jgi:uncharacterized protein (DUF2336 family)
MTEIDSTDGNYLLMLARDKSVASRRSLIATISDLFFSPTEVLSERERELMTGILRQLVHDLEVSVRRTLAERLAREPNAPHELVVTLAHDDIDVAFPILVESEVLQDMELIEVIRNRTLEHQLAIALRKSLSEVVTDALVGTDSTDVIARLLDNPQAKISQKTMEYLVEQSQRVDVYQNPLLHRPDLNPALAQRMFWWVSAALRSFILNHFKIDTAVLDASMEESVHDLTRMPLSVTPKAMELAQQLADTQTTTPDLMVNSLRRGEVPLFIAMFSKYTGVRSVLVYRFVFEPGGEGLCVACRGAGIDRKTFIAIYRLSRKARIHEEPDSPETISDVLSLYDRLDAVEATAILNRWQRDAEFLRAIWQVDSPPQGGRSGS